MNKHKPIYYEMVYDLIRSIPPGRVTTYGQIADFLSLASPRMAGYALRQLSKGHEVPAHRVVNSAGKLTGKANFDPPQKMIELLNSEGIEVKNDKIVDFKKKLWIPSKQFY